MKRYLLLLGAWGGVSSLFRCHSTYNWVVLPYYVNRYTWYLNMTTKIVHLIRNLALT